MPLTFSRRSEGSTSRNEYHFLPTFLGVPSLMPYLRDYGRMSNFKVYKSFDPLGVANVDE